MHHVTNIKYLRVSPKIPHPYNTRPFAFLCIPNTGGKRDKHLAQFHPRLAVPAAFQGRKKEKFPGEKREIDRSLRTRCPLVSFLLLRAGKVVRSDGATSWHRRQLATKRFLGEKIARETEGERGRAKERGSVVGRKPDAHFCALHGRATTTAAINNRSSTRMGGWMGGWPSRFTFFTATIRTGILLDTLALSMRVRAACTMGKFELPAGSFRDYSSESAGTPTDGLPVRSCTLSSSRESLRPPARTRETRAIPFADCTMYLHRCL